MNLEKLLQEKKSAYLKRWFNLIVETYPDETSRFLKYQKDRFANPVGHTLTRGLEILYEAVVTGVDAEKAAPALNDIVRIRAIQNFSPSQAVAFVFILKRVFREAVKESRMPGLYEELLEFETRIDQLALLAFDQFMSSREKLYDLKTNELRRQTYRLLQRAKIIGDSLPASDLNSPEEK
ncbi:MAG TPA: RsbRD N-terminal domain-containing protein [Thermodesulfobacteriota bacterium]|nr:RsbRD N-terminal domain-containing protein [Thermodesulfobacteriota bacterium]